MSSTPISVPYLFTLLMSFTMIESLTRDTIHVNNRSYIAWKIYKNIKIYKNYFSQYIINAKFCKKMYSHVDYTFARASRPYSASIKVWVFCMTSPPAAMTLCERAVLRSFELMENKLAVSFKALLFSIISLSSSNLKVTLPWKKKKNSERNWHNSRQEKPSHKKIWKKNNFTRSCWLYLPNAGYQQWYSTQSASHSGRIQGRTWQCKPFYSRFCRRWPFYCCSRCRQSNTRPGRGPNVACSIRPRYCH